jgi:tetratricopeptide (TPR) repeat protein
LINRIEGQVYDPNRLPVQNVYVELLNDVDSMIGQTRTNATGRFTFSGMPAGRFIIKVLPLGTNLLEQTQEVQIANTTRNSNDTAYVDFHLRYDTRGREAATELSHEVVFVQEVPPAAKKIYEEGLAIFAKNQEKGLAKLEEAVNLFPTYFDALHLLGKTYVSHQSYEKGYPYLLKAIDVNPRSYTSFYSLGYAFYQLKKYPAALEAAKATTALVPDSIDAQLLYGTILRIVGDYAEAEKALVKADTLAKRMNSEAHWQLALLYNRLNRTQDTINELETFLKLVPDSPDKPRIQAMMAKLKGATNKPK